MAGGTVPSAAACRHREMIPVVEPRNEQGCEECIRTGSTWVHLRVCLTCGQVGCCDSSPNRHALAHAHIAAHPLVASLEPGEGWRYCYATTSTSSLVE